MCCLADVPPLRLLSNIPWKEINQPSWLYIFFKAEILVNPSGFNSSCWWPFWHPIYPILHERARESVREEGILGYRRDVCGNVVRVMWPWCPTPWHQPRFVAKCRCCGDTDGKQDISSLPQCLSLPPNGSYFVYIATGKESMKKWNLLVGLEVIVPLMAVQPLSYEVFLLCSFMLKQCMHVNRFFIKLNPYKHQYWACLTLHHRTPSMSFARKPYFVFHLLRGLFQRRTADADIEFEFIQGRHNIRQYRGRQRGHWDANRLLGLWQRGKEIGPDDNASKPLQFVKKAALCHKTGMDFNTSGATALKRIIFRNGRKEIKYFSATWLVSKLWATCKVGAFRVIAASSEGPANVLWLMADLQRDRCEE